MIPAYTMKKEDIRKLVDIATSSFDVFGPVSKRNKFVFDKIEDSARLVMDYDSTILPPKKYFHPQIQTMMKFDLEKPSVDDTSDELEDIRPRLLVGVHSCDLNGILLLDRVFGGEYTDPYYFALREKTTIIGINCLDPCEFGFCRSMNTHHVVEGYDLFLTPIDDDKYFVHVGTSKGEHLVHMAKKLFKESAPEDLASYKAALRHKQESLPHEVNIENINEFLDMSFHDPIWEELGEDCVACGACAMVCPTCYCYDVIDELDLSLTHADRIRKWDTCLFTSFALVAGGHNFRETHVARLKYRFYHKMRGFAHDTGFIGCTGCGRCTAACPGNINIVDVLKRLQGAIDHAPVVRSGG